MNFRNTVTLTIYLLTFSDLSAQLNYPEARISNQVDNYHGQLIPDPYQWLECDTCPEVEAWVKRENVFTNEWFARQADREKIRERLTKIWSYNSMSAPVKKSGKIFFYKNNGTQNHNVLYYKNKGSDQENILLDPNTFSTDGTTAMTAAEISPDGKYVAYMYAHKGSDWNEIRIKEIESGKMLTDHLKWIKFSGISWKSDGFFYSRYDAPKGANEYSAKNEYHKVCYHKVGTDQKRDIIVFEDKKEPLRNFYFQTVNDGDYGVLGISQGTSGNSVMLCDLKTWKADQKIEWKSMIDIFDYDFSCIGEVKGKLLFLTNHNAPNQKLIAVDLNNCSSENWQELVAESEHVLESVVITKEYLLLKYLEKVSSKLYQYDFSGKRIKEVSLPVIGTVSSITADKKESDFYYSIVSYTFPNRIYHVADKNGNSELYFKPDIDFDSDQFETKQVFYTSKDGTKIPMFITHRKGIVLDGNNPCFLFGYGGFNISYTPEFRVDRSVFLENNGIYCVANIRGGGEFGEEWHKAGTQLKKQNVFDDFIAAAEFLIGNNYTNKHKLAIHGRSNGGLLAGACLTQRPDLFQCVIPQVGVLDMLKFHKFTIGWAWTGDYGSSDNEEQFRYLLNYSPVHNVRKTNYPATLIVTGDHDDRVVPAHSFKFAATLQANQIGDAPILIRIDSGGGHGSGKPLSMQIAEYSDMWTFVFSNLEMKYQR